MPDALAMNVSRLLAAGAAAGLASLVLGFSFAHFVLGDELEAALGERMPEPDAKHLAIVVATRLAIGCALAWLYAVAQTRFGPGIRTVLILLPAVWFLHCYVSMQVMAGFGFLPWSIALKWAAWGIVEMGLCLGLAAWIYRE
jgi:hypothetical protein